MCPPRELSAVRAHQMCNAFGFGAVHVWFLVSAALCVVMAVGGQIYGCSPSMALSGYGADYECNDNEEALFFFNNGWQVTIWGILVMVTLTRPPARTMLLIFSPFVLLSFALVTVFGVMNPSPEMQTSWTMNTIALVIWFGSLGYAYAVHVEPSSGSML